MSPRPKRCTECGGHKNEPDSGPVITVKDWEPVTYHSPSGERPAVIFKAPCGHEVVVLSDGIMPTGRLKGRLQCAPPPVGCRRIFDSLFLEGWAQ